MNYLLVVFVSLVGSLVFMKLFEFLNIMDSPGLDIIPKRNPVPTVQGVSLFLLLILNILILNKDYLLDSRVIGLLVGGLLLVVVGVFDDLQYIQAIKGKFKKGVSAKVRLGLQILVSLIALWIGGVGFKTFLLPGGIDLQFSSFVGVVLTIVWFAGFMNAFNWFDGVNGLASGISTVGYLTICLLIKFVVIKYYPSISPERLANLSLVFDLSFVFFVINLIFSFIEFKPRGLLRDSGVMLLGYGLAYLSLMGGAKIGTLLVVLSLVIFDAIWVVINRVFIMKKNPLKGDFTHFHYRLMALGWNKIELRMFAYIWSVFLMVLMILQGVNRFNKVVIFVMMFLIFFGVNVYLFWVKKLRGEFMKGNKEF